jgi:hypothetical protein
MGIEVTLIEKNQVKMLRESSLFLEVTPGVFADSVN